MTDLTGQYLGRYYLTERLGEGGMAVVYKAYDTRLERDVAIKIIRSGAFPMDEIAELLKRFEREAKSLAKLSHHSIVKVYDYGEHEGFPYLVMEYLPGGTLKMILGKPVPWQDAVRLILPVARGVAYAHQRGILHRDIKPANVLITDNGEPMLSDFGIAKLFEGEQTTVLTGSGMAIGTPEYMAPEQWTGTTSQQSDLYSLGIVLYEMVAGRKPYVADTPAGILIKQATEPLPSPRKFSTEIPETLEHVLIKALAKEPKDRYIDLNAFINALENLNLSKIVVQPPPEPKLVEETYRIPAQKLEPPVPTEIVTQINDEPVTEVVESQKAEEPLPVKVKNVKPRVPIKFSRRGAGILIGGVIVVLMVWLGSPLMGMLFSPSLVPITPTITEIQSTPTTIKKIPSSTVPPSLTPTTTYIPTTTFTPTLPPPTQTPLPEGVLFFDDFEGVQQNYVFYPSRDALQASIREWIPDGDHGNVLRIKPKDWGNIKFGEYSWTDYSLEFDFQMSGTLDNTNEENWFAIIMRASSENNYDQYVSFVQLFTKGLIHAYQSYGLPIASIEGTSMPIRPDRWYHFKIEIINNLMFTYLDDNFILQSWDNRITSGKPGFDFTWGTDMTFYFDNIRVEELK